MQDVLNTSEDANSFSGQKYLLNASQSKSSTFSAKTVESENAEKLFCKICNKMFSTKGNLRNHINTIHDDYRPFKCSFPNCNKRYEAESKLIAHQRTHTGVRPFVCQICQKSFNEKGNLKTHLKFHSEIRPFKCPLCEKEYKSRGHLKDHIEIQHYLIKKFKCQYCDKSFGRISTLKAHIIVHTKEKKFQCKFEGCGKRFTEKRNMEMHYARHLKKMNQKVENVKEKKVYGSKEIENDFEEKVKNALAELDSNKNKKKENLKIEIKNENKTDTSSIEVKGKISQNCGYDNDDIKIDDRYNLDNSDNLYFGNYPDLSNDFPLNINSKKSNDDLNDIVEKMEENYNEDENNINENNFIKNNINNNINGNINYSFKGNKDNNLDLLIYQDFSNLDFINNDLYLNNEYLDLDLNKNDLNENNNDFVLYQQKDFL